MIHINNLLSGYGPCDVIQNISAEGKQGELIALVGANGSGKSTLLKTLAGIITPTSGTINYLGKDLAGFSSRKRAKIISYLAQNREAYPSMPVYEIVELGRAPYRGSLGQISSTGKDIIESAMVRTKTQALKDRKFNNLSGGEQARVLLARALAVDAPIILADEPISALDPAFQISMMQALQREAKKGKIVITALHDLSLASQFSSKIWMLKNGKIVAKGVPKKVLNAENLKNTFQVKLPKGGFKALQLAN